MPNQVAGRLSFRKWRTRGDNLWLRLPFDGLLCAVFSVLLLLASLPDVSLAQNGESGRAISTPDRESAAAAQIMPRFERIFVPARQPELWPDGKWIPIEAKRVLPLLNGEHLRKPIGQTWFSSAVYSATFDPVSQTLIAGSAKLEIAASANRSSSRSGPVPDFVPLDPLNLSIQSATWDSDGKRAVLGADSEGEQKLFSRGRNGQLNLAWKKSARQTPFGLEFDIALPRAIVTKLQLTLPEGWLATTAESGIPLTTGNSSRPWSIPLGIRNRVRVRVSRVNASASPSPAPPIAWNQNTRFAVRLDSLQGFAEFRLADSERTAASLPMLLVPEEYKIDSIRDAANRPVLWKREEPVTGGLQRIQLATGSDANSVVDRFTMTFSPAKPSRQLQLTLKAPRLSSGILLNNSRVNVNVAAPLTVGSYVPSGLRLLETSPPVDDAGGGDFRLTFQQFLSDSQLDLQLSRPGQTGASLDVRELALLQLDQTPPTLIADIQLTAGTRDIFDFRTLLPRNWEVNSVQLVTPGRPAQPDPNGDDRQITWKLQDDTDSHRRLTVDFADSLPLKRPVTLRIHAELPDAESAAQISPVAVPDLPTRVELTIAVIEAAPPRTTLNSSLFQQLSRTAALGRADWSTLISATDEDTRFWSARLWNGPEEALSTKLLISKRPVEASATSAEEVGPSPSDIEKSDPADRAASPQRLRPVATAQLTSRISAGTGRDEHGFTWRFLYPLATGVFQFTLPESATLLLVEWDGERTPVSEVGRVCSIPVPQSENGQSLTVRYTLPSADVFLRGTYRAAVPHAQVEIAGFRWVTMASDEISIVSFSDDFSIYVDPVRSVESTLETANPASTDWLVWFFGPLARSSKQSAFNPLAADSWVSWTTTPPPTAEETAGWNTVTAEAGSMPESLALHICNVSRLHHLAWFVLIVAGLVGAALRAWQVTVRSRVGILWVTCCIASATIVPATYAELIGAGVLGSILAALIPRRLIRPTQVKESVTRTMQKSMPSTITMKNIPIGMILFAVAAGSGLAAGFAQDEPAVSEPIIQVLIPYEDPKNPTATTPTLVYVERSALPLLESLAPQPDAPLGSLVTRADYRGTIDAAGRLQLTAELIVAVRGTPGQITLGIPARFLTGRSESQLDGKPVKLLPDVSSRRLMMTLPGPEAEAVPPDRTEPTLPDAGLDEWSLHTLSFNLRPEITTRGESVVVTMPVPPVSDSRIVLTFSELPGFLRVNSSTVPVGAFSNRLERNLEPSTELQIEWATGDGTPLQITQPKIACRSSAVVYPEWIDRHLTVKYPAGSISRYLAWRLPVNSLVLEKSIKAPGLSGVQTRSTAEGQIVLLELAPPSESFLIEIPWRQPQSRPSQSGFSAEVPVDPFHTGTTLAEYGYLAGFAPALGFHFVPTGQEPPSETNPEPDPTLASWQSFWVDDARPRPADIVVRLDELATLQLDVAPQTALRAARPTQLLTISRDQVQMRYTAEVEIEQAAAFVHELRIPPQLTLDSVTVFEDDVDRLSHWVRRGPRLYLHLGSGTTGRQNIVLEGRFPVAADGRVSVGEVEVENARSEDSVVRILRPPELNVVAEDGLELAAANSPDETREATSPDAEASDAESTSQLSTRYRYTSAKTAAPRTGVVIVSSAAPRDRVHCLTILRTTQPASLDAELLILARSLQKPQLTIQFPDWPFASGSIPHAECVDLLNQQYVAASQTLTLSFSAPVPKTISVLVLASLTRDVAANSPDTGPEQNQLKPPAIDASNVALFLADATTPPAERTQTTPAQPEADQQSLVRFLDQYHEPAFMRLLLDSGLVDDAVTWQNPLTLSDARPALTSPSSKALVMHALMPGRRNSAMGVTRILLVPDKQNAFMIDWPEDIRPIAVYVNDRPQQIEVPENGRLSVSLPGEATPQLVELLWQQDQSSSGLKIRRTESHLPALRIPYVEPAPILIMPSRGTSVLPVDAKFDEEASQTLLNSLEEWDARFPQARGCEILTTRILEAMADIEDPLADEAASSDPVSDGKRIQSLMKARLRFESSPAPGDQSGMASGIESVFQNRDRPATLVAVRGSSPVSVWVIDDRLDEILTSILIALLAFSFVWLLLNLETGDRLAVNPTMSWLVIGLIWWLCLRASPAGLLVAGVSLVCLTLQMIRSQRHTKSAS